MSFFQKLLPGQTPISISEKDPFAVIQERIFQQWMLLVSSLGLSLGVYWSLRQASNGDREAAIATGALIAIFLTITLLRRMPYLLRAVLFLAAYLLYGAWFLLHESDSGTGFLILLAAPGFASVFLGARGAIAGLFLSILAVFGVGLASTSSLEPRPSFSETTETALGFTLITMIFTLAVSWLVSSLKKFMGQQADIRAELAQEQASLEQRVQQRTSEIERRLVQLRTAAEISRSVTSMLDPEELLQRVVELIHERNNYYYVGVFLVDERREYAVLMAGTGEAGQRMLATGHRLQVGGSSMIGWCTSNRQARIALDVGAEAVRFNNPYLPLTRSELALPIISRGLTIGALTVQSAEPNAFDESDIVILQGIADSLAIAIDNARLFQQSRADLEEIRALNRRFLQEAWSNVSTTQGHLQFQFENKTISQKTRQTNVFRFPIVLREQKIGQITIDSKSAILSEEDKEMVETILNQTALAMESARLLEETQQRASQEEKVNVLSAEFSRATTIEQILKTALRELGQLPSVAEVSVRLSPSLPDAAGSSPPNGKNGKSQED